MKETDLQFHIKKSIIKDGGYCKKLTNHFTIGIPDLLIRHPNFAPIVAEVKELGECVDKFDRQLDVTPKQGENLLGIAPYSCLLVGLEWRGQRHLVGLVHLERRLDHKMLEDWPERRTTKAVGNYYNLYQIFNGLNMRRS